MQEVNECTPGRRATVSLEVSDADTALALGSGDVPVLATPRVLALAEQAAMQAIGSSLPEGRTSVGAWAEVEHLLPTPVGERVDAEAVLLGVHGRRLEFSVTVRSGDEEVAHIRHRRVIVSRARFGQPAGPSSAQAADGPAAS
jgi:fluoroacetyl-CoA thioesterase